MEICKRRSVQNVTVWIKYQRLLRIEYRRTQHKTTQRRDWEPSWLLYAFSSPVAGLLKKSKLKACFQGRLDRSQMHFTCTMSLHFIVY